MVKGVIVDWDGTLVDSLRVGYKAYFPIFKKFSIPKISFEEYRYLLGGRDWGLFLTDLGVPPDRLMECRKMWSDAYRKLSSQVKLYSGAIEFLEKVFARKPLVLASGGSGLRVRNEVKKFGVEKFFRYVITKNDVANPKPHPETVQKAVEFLGYDPGECVYVGDTRECILTGRRAGVKNIGVTWGLHPSEILSKERPYGIANTFNELYDLLFKL